MEERQRRVLFDAFCEAGHRVIISTEKCYSMHELSPGVYEYVIGECRDVEDACG
jgi:hypothetical protein